MPLPSLYAQMCGCFPKCERELRTQKANDDGQQSSLWCSDTLGPQVRISGFVHRRFRAYKIRLHAHAEMFSDAVWTICVRVHCRSGCSLLAPFREDNRRELPGLATWNTAQVKQHDVSLHFAHSFRTFNFRILLLAFVQNYTADGTRDFITRCPSFVYSG